jgi:hypothetical protein
MSKYWFKPKRYGYGFYPVSWEGWLAILGVVILILISGAINNQFMEPGPTAAQSLRFLLDIILFSVVATLLFEKKMQEPLKWRWRKRR